MTTFDYQEKIISLLSEVNRKGIDNLIQFIKDSTYLTTARCYKHHKGYQGLMMHSLEVFDVMDKNNVLNIPRESIILTSLCHDLGKARLNGKKVGRGFHPQRSIDILNQCGVELTDLERDAIRFHHPKGAAEKVANVFRGPLQCLLHLGDCTSTRINKRGDQYRFSRL